MSWIDWTIMLGTLFTIVGVGVWKTRGAKDIQGFLKGDNAARWWTIGLSVMATQASAITFMSTPGQGFEDGMRFIQFYFGLPLAMIIISVVFIPLYYKLKVYTAYEFLESRFDRKTRVLTAGLFLLQRGLAAGITIYAPAIILSQILGWTLNFTVVFIGTLVIIYTVSGGTKAVSQTHKQQMAVIFAGMFCAFGILVWKLGDHLSFGQAVQVAGKMGKMNVIDLDFDLSNRYTLWSGLLGGLFLQLSYFGTDQSQVQRYISGQSIAQSRLGLMFNGLLKIPMQFFILLTGVLVFVFYQFHDAPVHFNELAVETVATSERSDDLTTLQNQFDAVARDKRTAILTMVDAMETGTADQVETARTEVMALHDASEEIRRETRDLVAAVAPDIETQDTDYIFIHFVMDMLPIGLVGLLLAVIFSAAMSSTSAELNALASTMTVDIYKRNVRSDGGERHELFMSRLFTAGFGVLAIAFALLASLFENLIEAVNILGSLFYGTILGIFLTAFFVRRVRGTAVFLAALVAEAGVIAIYVLDRKEVLEVEYLWLNLIGCLLVVVLSLLFTPWTGGPKRDEAPDEAPRPTD